MKLISEFDHVKYFVKLQNQLFTEFAKLHPEVKDFKWLIDFPKKGTLSVDDHEWSFNKHGSGLKFEKLNSKPYLVVDMHKRFDEPNIIDEWRLSQFVESSMKTILIDDIPLLICELCLQRKLIALENNLYLFVD